MGIMQMTPNYPSLYEESIERRGQHVLWYSATACYCINDNGQPDPNCKNCYGKGFNYSLVKSTRRIIWAVTDGRRVVDMSQIGVNIQKINRVVLGKDIPIELSEFTHNSFTPVNPIKKGIRYNIDFVESFEHSYVGSAKYIGGNLIEVPIILMNNQNYFAGAITEVVRLFNATKNESIEIKGIWANRILTSSLVEETDEIEIECKYVKALKLLITSINPKTRTDNNQILQQADAMMAFPGTYHIGRGDVIILQMAELKETIIGYNEGDSYKFPYQSIAQILRIGDRYGEITDYELVRDNEIIWKGRKPTRFSCSFTYHPAFSVLDDLPTLRYSDDKIWPKRVFLKKFSTFTHSSKVLSIENISEKEEGLLDSPAYIDSTGGLI